MTFIHSSSLDFADHLQSRIDAGDYVIGDRLPSTAVLSKRHGIPITTVRGSLHLLSREGVIASTYAQNGYYVTRRGSETMVPPPMPLQKKVVDDLRRKIIAGTYKPAQKLPSIRKLAKAYGVSAGPVRQALEMLVDEHLLTTLPRKGVYVSMPPENSPEESSL